MQVDLSPDEQAKSDKLKERDNRKAKISFSLNELDMWDAIESFPATPYALGILNRAMEKIKQAREALEKCESLTEQDHKREQEAIERQQTRQEIEERKKDYEPI